MGLADLLRDQRRLVVLDDVWATRDAAAFNVDSDHARLLITTRDARVIRGLGAADYNLDEMAPEEALALLANFSGVDRDELPPEASGSAQGGPPTRP